MLTALAAVQAANVTHRDVKPENLLVPPLPYHLPYPAVGEAGEHVAAPACRTGFMSHA